VSCRRPDINVDEGDIGQLFLVRAKLTECTLRLSVFISQIARSTRFKQAFMLMPEVI
jgi:hypothetical protein